MKKLPCLFQRRFEPRANGRGAEAILLRDVTPGLEWVLEGLGVATRKWDGTACMVKDGALYKRYDAKRGKPAPANGIPCDEPDPVTGHWPHWIPVGEEPESKWHLLAWRSLLAPLEDGTYELCGPQFNANPEAFECLTFAKHGASVLDVPDRSFDGIRAFLTSSVPIEGIVFWRDGEPSCKIRRGDFGLAWGNKRPTPPAPDRLAGEGGDEDERSGT